MSNRIKEDLIWNSTANIQGGAGNNLALDLVNEFLNNEFKGKYNYPFMTDGESLIHIISIS